MTNFVQNVAQDIAQSAKIATAVSTTTIGSGVATILEWIPDDIGKVATLIGMLLSTILIYTHIKKYKREGREQEREEEKHKLQIEILTLERETVRNGK